MYFCKERKRKEKLRRQRSTLYINKGKGDTLAQKRAVCPLHHKV
jgi:hypothetical protein